MKMVVDRRLVAVLVDHIERTVNRIAIEMMVVDHIVVMDFLLVRNRQPMIARVVRIVVKDYHLVQIHLDLDFDLVDRIAVMEHHQNRHLIDQIHQMIVQNRQHLDSVHRSFGLAVVVA